MANKTNWVRIDKFENFELINYLAPCVRNQFYANF